MLEWDFSLPGEVPAPAPAPKPVDALDGLKLDGFKADNFRALPSADDALMVYCIGCGEPMPLVAAIAHGCDLPPAGML